MADASRRQVLQTTALGTLMFTKLARAAAAPDIRFDFARPLEGWKTVSGSWAIAEVPGAIQKGTALVQSATTNAFNVIVAPGGPYTNVEVSVRFKPICGREDASGGIVFRFSDGRYYVIRVNALEDNFNFYYYDRRRYQIAGVRVKAPALGAWHKLRITAIDDRIEGWVNDALLISQRDNHFASGQIGLWTKADSVTAFDELVVRPEPG
jgi:hypothetical protein